MLETQRTTCGNLRSLQCMSWVVNSGCLVWWQAPFHPDSHVSPSLRFVFIISLGVLYTMFTHFHPPSLSPLHSPSLPTPFCVLAFPRLTSNLCSLYISGIVAFHWSMVNSLGPTFWKKTDSPSHSSYQFPITPGLGVGLHVYHLSKSWDFVWIEFALDSYMCAVTMAVSSHTHLSCYVGGHGLPVVTHCLWLL